MITVKIDYISISLPGELTFNTDEPSRVNSLLDALDALGGRALTNALIDMDFHEHPAFRGYKYCLRSEKTFALVLWGGSYNHTLLEFPGTACSVLDASDDLDALLLIGVKHATRIDVAADSVDFGLPKHFISYGYSGRIKTRETRNSPTGDTEYLGSRHSDKFARVYQYHAPHPRAGITRVEVSLKGALARAACKKYRDFGLELTCIGVSSSFGFKSPNWNTEKLTTDRVRTHRNETVHAETLRWLITQVAPSIVRLHSERVIDVDAFINEHVRPKIR